MTLVQPAQATSDDALVDSYRRLADVFHDVLSEQSLDALLDRVADTLAELIHDDDMHIYAADEAKQELTPVLARSKWEQEVMSETFPFGEGITGWACPPSRAGARQPGAPRSRVRFVPGTPIEAGGAHRRAARRRGLLKGTLNIYREGEEASFGAGEFELARRLGDAAALALDNAHIRAGLEHQAQTDSLTGLYSHRYFHERLRAKLTRASSKPRDRRRRDARHRRFQAHQRHLRAPSATASSASSPTTCASVRSANVVCRIGGEEFARRSNLYGRAASTLASPARLAERLEETDFELAGRISVSIGIAHGPSTR